VEEAFEPREGGRAFLRRLRIMGAGRASLALLSSTLLFGCGEGERSNAPVGAWPKSVPEDGFVTLAFDAVCRTVAPCCEQEGYAFDRAYCEGLVTLWGPGGARRPDGSAVVYDPEAAGACIVALWSETSLCTHDTPAANRASREACRAVYRGTRTPGEACETSSDCAPVEGRQVSCRPPDGSGSGEMTCSIVPSDVRGDGEPCFGFCVDVAPEVAPTCLSLPSMMHIGAVTRGPGEGYCNLDEGLRCDFDQRICVPVIEDGQSCRWDWDCAVTSFCDCREGNVDCACVPRKPPGAAATRQGECQRDSTVGAGVCVRLLGEGEACSPDAQCKGYCKDGFCTVVAEAPLSFCGYGGTSPAANGVGQDPSTCREETVSTNAFEGLDPEKGFYSDCGPPP
jgi:hypothetical protein